MLKIVSLSLLSSKENFSNNLKSSFAISGVDSFFLETSNPINHIRELAIYEIESIDKENCKYFSTKEKAEAKLKELRGGENG